MSEVRERLYKILDMDISGKNKVDYMLREFHISEKLTEEEKDKIDELKHYSCNNEHVFNMLENVKPILNKLIGESDEKK